MKETQHVIIVAPPPVISMANGPAMALPVLDRLFSEAGLKTTVLDANVRFFRYLCEPDVRQKIVSEFDRLINQEIRRSTLDQNDLTKLGRLLAFRIGEQNRQDESLQRSGYDWAGAHELVVNPQDYLDTHTARGIWNDALDKVVDEIISLNPDHVIFTLLFNGQVNAYIQLCRKLRKLDFRGRIVVGGAEIKLSEDAALLNLLKDSGSDMAYRFNLYTPPLTLAAWFQDEIGISSVEHATWINNEGQIQHNQGSDQIVKHLLGKLSYKKTSNTLYFPERIYPVLVSDGCYWGKCDFCDYPYLASRDPFRISAIFRSPKDVVSDVKEISHISEVTRIDLISDAVPMGWFKRANAAGLGKLIREKGLKLECSVRAEPKAQEQHFDEMVECGLDSITLGVEALADEVLLGMKKGNCWADIKRVATQANDRGLRVKANLIYDHPRIQSYHLAEMQNNLIELAPLLDSVGVHSFGLSPHAPIAFELEKVGLDILPNNERDTNDHGSHHLAFRRSIPDPERERVIKTFRSDVENLAFKLDIAKGRATEHQKILSLPFKWNGNHAIKTKEDSDLMIQIPGKQSPFYFFVGALTDA